MEATCVPTLEFFQSIYVELCLLTSKFLITIEGWLDKKMVRDIEIEIIW